MYWPEKGHSISAMLIIWKWRFLILGIFFFFLTLVALPASQRPTAFPRFPPFPTRDSRSETSMCNAYTPLYKDAITTHKSFTLLGGITYKDYLTSQTSCENEGQCIQIKLHNGELYIGNISQNPHCGETRAESLIMNIYRAVEQAKWEGEKLPNIDVFLMCSDLPDGNKATWYLTKRRETAAMQEGSGANYFLMPDFNFYAWPESYGEPYA
jgi:hypothetical protein